MNIKEKYALYKQMVTGPHVELEDFEAAKSFAVRFSDFTIDGEHSLLWVPDKVQDLYLTSPIIGPLFFATDNPETIKKLVLWEHRLAGDISGFEIPGDYVSLQDVSVYDSFNHPIRFDPKLSMLRDLAISSGPGTLDLTHANMKSLRSISIRGSAEVKFADEYPNLETFEWNSTVVPKLPKSMPKVIEFFYESTYSAGLVLPPLPEVIELHIDGCLEDTTSLTPDRYPKVAALSLDGPLSDPTTIDGFPELELLTICAGHSTMPVTIGSLPKVRKLKVVGAGTATFGNDYPELVNLRIASITSAPKYTRLKLNTPKLAVLDLIWDGLISVDTNSEVLEEIKLFSQDLTNVHFEGNLEKLIILKIVSKKLTEFISPAAPKLREVYIDCAKVNKVAFHHSSYELKDVELEVASDAEIEFPELTSHLKYVKLPARMVMRHAKQRQKITESLNSVYELSDDRDVQKEIQYILDEM